MLILLEKWGGLFSGRRAPGLQNGLHFNTLLEKGK
jgi:hypothetical protein